MAQFLLKVASERSESKTYTLDPGKKYVLGRLEDCDIVVNDALLSRRHCQLSATARGAILLDLGSQNGTYLNGARVQEELVLPGDHVQIGRTRIFFNAKGEMKSSSSMSSVSLRTNPFRDDPPPKMTIHPCMNCGAELTNHDLLHYAAFQSENGTLCLACFCKGEGEFTNFGKYRLYRKIGSGAFATVYLAIHLSLQRPVALKVFKELEGVREKSLQRFLREGRTGARLSHPNIVQYLDAGTEDSKHYLALEFVDGLDTRQRLFRAGFFNLGDALHIARQVADALHFAHEKGAVHRDVKPENIIINRQGETKVSDFGLAKFLNEIGTTEITESGALLGILAYSPPEQIFDSRSVDGRSDIYALAATLFEFLGGKAAFPGKFSRETVEQIQNRPPPVDEIDTQPIPPAVKALLLKGMAKDPKDRYQTAGDVLVAIDEALAPPASGDLDDPAG